MDPITQQTTLAASGGRKDPVYVDDVFSTFLYDGNGSTQTINNGIDVSGEGALVWIRNRDPAGDHIFTDTERGTNTILESNRSRQAQTKTDMITSFTSTGFAVAGNGHVNENGDNICSWTFRKAKGFFDVVTYTGYGFHRDISHSLGSEPGSIWIKRTDGDESWIVYHRSLDQGGGSGATAHMAGLELESTGDQYGGTLRWSASGGGEDHTATTFHVSGHSAINGSGMTYVAYIFAHDDQSFGEDGDESAIKCGSYTCDSSGGVAPIDLGFEPQWLLVKKTTGAKDWVLVDNMRRWTADGGANWLQANDNSAENSADTLVKLNSTGFQPHNSSLVQDPNDSFIYIAIRRPHKPPSAGTDVFKPELLTSLTQTSTPGFAPDLVLQRPERSSTNSFFVGSRLSGNGKYLQTAATSAEGSFTSWKFDAPTGKFTQSLTTGSTSGGIQHFFKRAPGFFDVVAYAGHQYRDASTNISSVPHNLGVVPEMIWIKSRTLSSSSSKWVVYHKDLGTSNFGVLNDTALVGTNYFLGNTPTNSVFKLFAGGFTTVDYTPHTYIAYLFATLPGISKVGTYAGTGSNIDIDCGFTTGARFVLIKRITSGWGQNWWVFDSARGIGSGNDPALYLNATSAEYNSDRIAPLSSGFTVGTGDFELNASGANFIFYAIA